MRVRVSSFILLLAAGCQTTGPTPVADAPAPPVQAPAPDAPVSSPAVPPLDDVQAAFAAALAPKLANRYFEGECADGAFPDWEAFPLRDCTYHVVNADGARRDGRAIMLNPDAERLTRWIFSACAAAALDNPACRERLRDWIMAQSGAQFIVAGLVWEDLNRDGVFEGYTFRKGVTVKLAGLPNGGVAPFSEAQLLAAVSPDTAVTSSRRYARIASTSPDDYRANGGAADVGTTAAPGLAWPATAGALYRAAWNSGENELITAWAKAHPDLLR